MRSKINWYEYSEMSSKYFLNLEKRNNAKTHIRKITINDVEINNPSVIMSSIENFYSVLYKRCSVVKQRRNALTILNILNIPKAHPKLIVSHAKVTLQ